MRVLAQFGFAALAIVIAVSGCSQGSANGLGATVDESEIATSAGEGEAGPSELEVLGFFEPEVLQQLETLQLGIDIAIEEGVKLCMAAEGFDYTQRPINELASSLGIGGLGPEQYFNLANGALSYISDERSLQNQNVNTENLESLSDLEKEAWLEQETQCFVTVSEEHVNPLASETNWYSDASDEASERTFASSEYIKATADFRSCLSGSGISDIDGAASEISERVEDIVSRYQSGQFTRREAENELQEIADQERDLSSTFSVCDEPYRRASGDIHAKYMREIVDRDRDKVALWVDEFWLDVEPYLLDE